MSNLAIAFFSVITGGLISGATSYVITSKMFQEQRFDTAATKFRAIIIEDFGRHPSINGESFYEPAMVIDCYQRGINTAATEFEIFSPRKNEFVQTIQSFNDFCWEQENVPYEDWPQKVRKKFTSIVDELLSFTKKESFADKLRKTLTRLPGMVKKVYQCKF